MKQLELNVFIRGPARPSHEQQMGAQKCYRSCIEIVGLVNTLYQDHPSDGPKVVLKITPIIEKRIRNKYLNQDNTILDRVIFLCGRIAESYRIYSDINNLCWCRSINPVYSFMRQNQKYFTDLFVHIRTGV